jgi:hypothetical protein
MLGLIELFMYRNGMHTIAHAALLSIERNSITPKEQYNFDASQMMVCTFQ